MKLLPNEEKIILTNHRIQMTDKIWGQSSTISIFLEDISSIELKYRSNILLLILGGLSILAGFFIEERGGGNDFMMNGIIVGVIFFAIWWFSRTHFISISSDGGSALNFVVKGMDEGKINDFVDNVSLAKQTRVNQLAKI